MPKRGRGRQPRKGWQHQAGKGVGEMRKLSRHDCSRKQVQMYQTCHNRLIAGRKPGLHQLLCSRAGQLPAQLVPEGTSPPSPAPPRAAGLTAPVASSARSAGPPLPSRRTLPCTTEDPAAPAVPAVPAVSAAPAALPGGMPSSSWASSSDPLS